MNPEWSLVTIGRGSFASVSILSGRPVAFKHVLVRERSVELKTEFQVIRSLYDLCDTDSFFGIPRPLAFYDPQKSNSFISVGGSPPYESRRRPLRSLVSECDFKLLELDTAAYAMDQVLPVPLSTAKTIRTLFYPPNMPHALDPTLCRLYFGKVIKELGPSGSTNFPLDVSRYCKLLEVSAVQGDCVYPSVEDIAYGMGEILGRLHWRAGYDGRDVEFIMGGASFSGVAMYIIDFNQLRTWKRNPDEIQQLVEAFYTNDPYYPCPNLDDPLYKEFSNGYLSAHPKQSRDAIDVAEAFLRAIENEQRRPRYLSKWHSLCAHHPSLPAPAIERVAQGDCVYPSVEDIAYGMGEILGRLHWRAGYDGRDVEFIMGGASFSGVAMYIIDFNQLRTWKRNPDEIQQLVEAFYTNDPYYPCPNLDDPLYKEFSNGYLSAHPKQSRDAIDVAEAFLRAIENEQRRRISANLASIS